MKRIKYLAWTAGLSLIAFELVAYVFAKENIRGLYSRYHLYGQDVSYGYPKDYFLETSRGHDIAKGTTPRLVSAQPEESKPYRFFGNSIGCFDHEKKTNSKYSVYLAGDSFTMGFAPLEAKFGTLIETAIKKPVAACGVTGTGQTHQFRKFKEIRDELGYTPSLVIVNLHNNDIEDDFLYPRFTSVYGFIKNWASSACTGSKCTVLRTNKSRMLSDVKEWHRHKWARELFDPRNVSATAILAEQFYSFMKGLRSRSGEEVMSPFHPYIATGDNTIRNFRTIEEWIADASERGYRLIFSGIPLKHEKDGMLVRWGERIKSAGGTYIDFEQYIGEEELEKSTLYWKRNGHFNEYGNRVYADFLLQHALDESRTVESKGSN